MSSLSYFLEILVEIAEVNIFLFSFKIATLGSKDLYIWFDLFNLLIEALEMF